ncbi:MAG: hypothetical protein ACPGJU_00460 [Coraliomargarita sp.]
MLFKQFLIICVVTSFVPFASSHAGLFSPKGDDIEEKRATIRKQGAEMLDELYEAHPELEESLKEAVGYATFRQSDIHLLVVASGFGYGVLHDNRDGKDTYMRVATLGGGLGAGVKDIRVVFVFNDEDVMDSFIEKGWQFGGKADASAKYEETGVAAEQNVKANLNLEEGEITGAASSDARAGREEGEQNSAGTGLGEAMQIYQFTESGISLQATVAGTKYWKSDKLNY